MENKQQTNNILKCILTTKSTLRIRRQSRGFAAFDPNPSLDGANMARMHALDAPMHAPDAQMHALDAPMHAPDAQMHAPDARMHALDAQMHAPDAQMHALNARMPTKSTLRIRRLSRGFGWFLSKSTFG